MALVGESLECIKVRLAGAGEDGGGSTKHFIDARENAGKEGEFVYTLI